MSHATHPDAQITPLEGGQLILAAVVLAAANFMVVLDTTIANVSVPNIAGGLGASSSQGTLVITSYAVAEAITVPLTGWLANRFGAVRTFLVGVVLFGLFSVLCGMAPSLGALIGFRILQGFAGGPLMPLSQTLLLRIFPKEKAMAATGLWAMTTLIAPIAGPILGGVICDEWSWHVIFLINAPVAVACAFFGWRMLTRYETPLFKVRIDIVGLILLVVWVGAFQTLLDEGRQLDWFASPLIVTLAIVAAIGFVAFLIWELTESEPIVDLRVFRHRGFTMSVVTICLAFGAFFGATVLTPQWLQSYMGYTATQAGLVTALSGILAVVAAPMAASLSSKVDVRLLVFLGVLWLGLTTVLRTNATTEMAFWQIGFLLFLQGVGMPFFFVPLSGLALSSVHEEETASAAGLLNFARTLSGAFATSVVTTVWNNQITRNHAELAGLADSDGTIVAALTSAGSSAEQALSMLDQLVQGQSVMIATSQVFMWAGCAFALSAVAVWFAPRPTRVADTSAVH